MATDSLLVISEVRSALAEAKTLGDVLAIREKSETVRRLLKISGESLAAQNEMAELTVRAEVMLGEAMEAMDKQNGRPKKGFRDGTVLLSEIGIDKKQSHRWQTMAKAKKLISRMVKQATEEGRDFTRAMVYREGQRIVKGEPEPKIRDAADIVGALRKHVYRLFDDHAELRSVLPCVLRELADELTGFMESNDGSGRGTRQTAASAA